MSPQQSWGRSARRAGHDRPGRSSRARRRDEHRRAADPGGLAYALREGVSAFRSSWPPAADVGLTDDLEVAFWTRERDAKLRELLAFVERAPYLARSPADLAHDLDSLLIAR